MSKKEKIGLCIGGGAARGYAAYPIINGLRKLDIDFDYLSGCSIGSIIGAYYCLHGEVDTLLESFKKISKKEWATLMDMNNPKKSVIKGRKLKKFLKENFFGEKEFSDLKIPLVIVATNLKTRKAEYFTRGLLVDAIMASASIPGIFPPYEIKGEYYIDGGVRENVPYNILFAKGMDRVVGIDFYTNKKSTKLDPNSLFDVLLNTFHMLLQTSKVYEKEKGNLFVFQPKFKEGAGKALRPWRIESNFNAGKKEFAEERKNFLKWFNGKKRH